MLQLILLNDNVTRAQLNETEKRIDQYLTQ
jgi:hypothetical protein